VEATEKRDMILLSKHYLVNRWSKHKQLQLKKPVDDEDDTDITEQCLIVYLHTEDR
jgi:hypothetical protein